MTNVFSLEGLFSLEGKVAVLSGASTGIGRHLAGTLAGAGAKVLLGARSVDKLRERVAEIRATGGVAEAAPLDVADLASVKAFFDAAERHFGGVDILVNNAGIEAGAYTYVTLEDDGWDAVIDTNLKGLWWMTRELTRRVAKNNQAGAVVVNISSITSERTTKGIFPYAVSKAGVNHATRVMALEGAKHNVRVNALAPGYIYTNVSKALLDSDVAPEFVKRIPQRRLGEFDDLDGPLLLLASDASRYMTGSIVVVDGGHTVSSL
jgi:NAD(P)-dependent dehydrogenase (short-subunit alcohol dehydrogenase family)